MNKRIIISTGAVFLSLALCIAALSPAISVSAENSAPIAENMEISTYRNVSVGGRLSAVDPDGDVLTYQVTTEPLKGELEVTEDGRYVYSPDLNKRGRDYFGYRVTDANGNVSQEATVIIRIQKQKGAVSYSDMQGSAGHYSAVALAEAGIFTGESLSGEWVFRPDEAVSRGDFLAMCMALTGADTLSGVLSTGFTDDDGIPLWQKRYVATALMDGAVSGYAGDNGAVFMASEPITRSEAAVMLDNLMELTEVSDELIDPAAPAWAARSAANLSACGILPSGCAYDDTLTRTDAAEMLCAALEILNNR